MVVVVAASQRKQSPSKDKANVAGVWATVYQHTIVEGTYINIFLIYDAYMYMYEASNCTHVHTCNFYKL